MGIIVSVSGYLISELIIYIAASYVLIGMCLFVRILGDMYYERKLWKTLIVGVVVLVAVLLFYDGEVRIGTVMFINGFLACFFIFELVRIMLVVYSKDVEEVVDGQESGSGA